MLTTTARAAIYMCPCRSKARAANDDRALNAVACHAVKFYTCKDGTAALRDEPSLKMRTYWVLCNEGLVPLCRVIMDWVGIVGALHGVLLALSQSLLAMAPPKVVVALWVLILLLDRLWQALDDTGSHDCRFKSGIRHIMHVNAE